MGLVSEDTKFGLQIYEEVLKTEEWKRKEGLDFVFFLPYHLNLVAGYQTALDDRATLHTFLDLFCNALHLALQLTTENSQVGALITVSMF